MFYISSFLSRSDICAALLKAAIRLDKTVTHSQNVLYFKFSVKVSYMSVIHTVLLLALLAPVLGLHH